MHFYQTKRLGIVDANPMVSFALQLEITQQVATPKPLKEKANR